MTKKNISLLVIAIFFGTSVASMDEKPALISALNDNLPTLISDAIRENNVKAFKMLLRRFDLKEHFQGQNTILHEAVGERVRESEVFISNIYMAARQQNFITDSKMKKQIKSTIKLAKKNKKNRSVIDALKNYKIFYSINQIKK